MKILVLDDNEIIVRRPFSDDFHDYTQDEFTVIPTVREFLIALYDNTEWDEVWLDHDLGLYEGKTGLDAVKAVMGTGMEHDNWPKVKKFIITTNSPVGDRMADDLKCQLWDVVRKPMYLLSDYGICRGDLIPVKS